MAGAEQTPRPPRKGVKIYAELCTQRAAGVNPARSGAPAGTARTRSVAAAARRSHQPLPHGRCAHAAPRPSAGGSGGARPVRGLRLYRQAGRSGFAAQGRLAGVIRQHRAIASARFAGLCGAVIKNGKPRRSHMGSSGAASLCQTEHGMPRPSRLHHVPSGNRSMRPRARIGRPRIRRAKNSQSLKYLQKYYL